MFLNKILDEDFYIHYYYKDLNNRINIVDNKDIPEITRGREPIDLLNLKIKIFVRKYVFQHEFIYDFLLPIASEYMDKISKYVTKTFIVGTTGLVINLKEHYNLLNDEEVAEYEDLLIKSDIDVYSFVHHDNSDAIKAILYSVLVDHKKILLKNSMFMFYLKNNITEYINDNSEFMTLNRIKSIKKIKLSDKIKLSAEIKLKEDDTYDELFIRVNNINFSSEGEPVTDLFRIMAPYKAVLDDNTNVSLWVELIDIAVKTMDPEITKETFDYVNDCLNDIHKILLILDDNIKKDIHTTIKDIPITNKTYNIPLLLYMLHEYYDDEYITVKTYEGMSVKVLTIKGYIYESVLIMLNTPNDPKIQNRLKKLQYILKIQNKYNI